MDQTNYCVEDGTLLFECSSTEVIHQHNHTMTHSITGSHTHTHRGTLAHHSHSPMGLIKHRKDGDLAAETRGLAELSRENLGRAQRLSVGGLRLSQKWPFHQKNSCTLRMDHRRQKQMYPRRKPSSAQVSTDLSEYVGLHVYVSSWAVGRI